METWQPAVAMVALAVCVLPAAARADSTPAQTVQPTRFEHAPVIDGRIDEAVWTTAARLEGFHQVQPGDNLEPSQHTEVLIDSGGYTVEAAIPFASLRYRSAEAPTWGLHVQCFIRRDRNEQISWVPLSRDRSSFLDQAGQLGEFTAVCRLETELLDFAARPRHRLSRLRHARARGRRLAAGGRGGYQAVAADALANRRRLTIAARSPDLHAIGGRSIELVSGFQIDAVSNARTPDRQI